MATDSWHGGVGSERRVEGSSFWGGSAGRESRAGNGRVGADPSAILGALQATTFVVNHDQMKIEYDKSLDVGG